MADDRLKIWETLFQRALVLIDSTQAAGAILTEWSFGGGTVLMRRHHHRFSKDIDIFVPKPQYLPLLEKLGDSESDVLRYLAQERGRNIATGMEGHSGGPAGAVAKLLV